MGLFGLGSRAQQPNRLGSIQVSTSEYGVAESIGWGSFKAPIKLLDYTDFTSIPFSAGGKGGNVSSYQYYAAIDAMICRGPIAGIGNIYDSGGSSQLIGAVETYTIGGSGSYGVQNGGTVFYYDEGVTRMVPYSVTAADYGSDGAVTRSGTQPEPFQKVSSAPGPLEYSVDVNGNYQFNTADSGTTVTITYAYTNADTVDNNNGVGSSGFDARSPALRLNLAYALGTTPQAPWSYMLSAHPERALGYTGLARVLSPSMSLGTTASTPSLSIEVINGRLKAFGNGVADCDPSAIITDMLTDPDAGCNWPYLGDLTNYSNFCVANSLFMSLFLDSIRKVTEILGELCDLTNSAAVWSGGLLKIVPYGDTTAVGYGRTYTPQTEPIYLIDDSEMICAPAAEPVEIGDPDLADNYNRVQLEYIARNDNYNTQLIHEQDEASILMNYLLPMKTVTAHQYCVQEYAAVMMGMLLRRKAMPLRTFSFTLPWYYQLLEPMDIIELNLQLGGLGVTPVRIVSIEEQEDYTLKVIAEDFLFGVAEGVVYPKGTNAGVGPGTHDLPGNTTLLAAFQPNKRITGGDEELWLALTGGSRWGGCDVQLSLDGNTYSSIGTQNGSARAGTLTAALPATADPDTTDTAEVTITGSIAPVSQTEADAFATLSLLGNELISYETPTLTGSTGATNSYAITYLRRGIFSTTVRAHAAGETFVRLDDSVFKYVIDPTLYGRTIYLKFLSFNLYGAEQQPLSVIQPVMITLGGSISSSMSVGSYVNTDGTDATVDVYLTAGGSGSGSATLTNGASVALPPFSWTPELLGTWYGVNFNPTTLAYVLYTSQSEWMADQTTMIGIGYTTTPATSTSGLSPDTYSDLGSMPTNNPTGAYTSGQVATVSSSASYYPAT